MACTEQSVVTPAESVNTAELEALMKEFPQWKEQFPDLYREINPPRYTKINRKGRHDKTEKMAMSRRATTVPVTDYRGTYIAHKQRPRSTKRPPPSPRQLNPPPMNFSTNQRSDFVPKDAGVRAALVKLEDEHEVPEGPMETQSRYMRDYPGHFTFPKVKLATDATNTDVKMKSAKFASNTTTKDHYKHWRPNPSLTFTELPSFADSILYPNQKRQLQTTTGGAYLGEQSARPEPIQCPDGNIRLEGDHDMDTTHKLTYHSQGRPQPALTAKPKNESIAAHRSKFDSTTQNQEDFTEYRNHRRPRPIDPAPSTIQLKFNNKTSFETEQRKEYLGIDVHSHPPEKLCKSGENEYKPPTEKFHTLTNQKADYRPIDLREIKTCPVKPHVELSSGDQPKFDGHTMNKEFFRKWETKPRVQYGDFYQGHSYIRPVAKFKGMSTTQETFVPKKGELTESFKPENKAFAKEGEIDFGTMYRQEYISPNPIKNMTKAQAKMLLRELKKMKKNTGACQRRAVMVQ